MSLREDGWNCAPADGADLQGLDLQASEALPQVADSGRFAFRQAAWRSLTLAQGSTEGICAPRDHILLAVGSREWCIPLSYPSASNSVSSAKSDLSYDSRRSRMMILASYLSRPSAGSEPGMCPSSHRFLPYRGEAPGLIRVHSDKGSPRHSMRGTRHVPASSSSHFESFP